jgi:hypothetical protein
MDSNPVRKKQRVELGLAAGRNRARAFLDRGHVSGRDLPTRVVVEWLVSDSVLTWGPLRYRKRGLPVVTARGRGIGTMTDEHGARHEYVRALLPRQWISRCHLHPGALRDHSSQ